MPQLYQFPHLSALNIAEIEAGVLKDFFPTWYALESVPQQNDWHDENVLQHMIDVLQNARQITDQLPPQLQAQFAQKIAGRTEREWFEWKVFFHDSAKGRTFQVDDKGMTSFPGHEAAGSQIVQTTLAPFECPPEMVTSIAFFVENHSYLHDVIGAFPVGSVIDTSAILRNAFQHFDQQTVLELIIFTQADVMGSRLWREDKDPDQFKWLMNVYNELLHYFSSHIFPTHQ